MTTWQKIVKGLAIAFAITLIIGIVSTIMGIVKGTMLIFKIGNVFDLIDAEMVTTEVSDGIKELDIDIGATRLSIEIGDKLAVETNDDKISITESGDTLKIKSRTTLFSNRVNSILVLYVPENYDFDGVTIDTGAGRLDIESLTVNDIELNFGAGEVVIKHMVAYGSANISAGAGKFAIEDGLITNLDLDMGVGNTEMRCALAGDSDIDCAMGNFELEVKGKKSDFKISVDKALGTVRIDGEKINGNTSTGSGLNDIDIDGALGNIRVDFVG